jgi:phospholipid-binding lipoprotein MlaA
VVFANYLLQLKPGKAAETAGRFAVNTTIGVAGLVDMAKRKPFNLPRRPNGFAYTLGYYGVKPGPFIFLPFLGPTTLRDAIGGLVDRAVVPGIGGPPFNQPAYAVPATGLGVLDRRAEFDEDLQRIRASDDPYVARREFYLRKRQREIDALHSSVHAVAAPIDSNGLSARSEDATNLPIITVSHAAELTQPVPFEP